MPLPGGSRGSFSDIMALAKSEYARAAIAVEGKVSETFGGLVKERTTNLSINSGVPERINFLKTQLGLGQSYESSLQQVRYQLLHRAASALIEAERIGANAAVMLVHSFSQTDEHLGDYQAFVELFDTEGGVNTVSYAGNKNGVDLYLGWVRGEETYLHR